MKIISVISNVQIKRRRKLTGAITCKGYRKAPASLYRQHSGEKQRVGRL